MMSGSSGTTSSNSPKLAGYFFTVVVVFGLLTLSFNGMFQHGSEATSLAEHQQLLSSALEHFLRAGMVDSSKPSSTVNARSKTAAAASDATEIGSSKQRQRAEKGAIKAKNDNTDAKKSNPSPAMIQKQQKDLGSTGDATKGDSYELAGLSCDKYGGPPKDVAREMVYWRDIPADADVSCDVVRDASTGLLDKFRRARLKVFSSVLSQRLRTVPPFEIT